MEYLKTFESYTFGREEFVEVTNPLSGEYCVVKAKIDTESYTSNIGAELASMLNLYPDNEPKKVYSHLGERDLPVAKCQFTFNTGQQKGEKLDTEVTVGDRSKLRHKLAIGRKDLEKMGILIDVRKSL